MKNILEILIGIVLFMLLIPVVFYILKAILMIIVKVKMKQIY